VNKLAGSVYEQRKSDIFEFRLLPGTRLSENDVARRGRVSRTPVREALFRLEREGYLEEVHAKECEAVRKIDPTNVTGLTYFLRRLESPRG
jgi:DNA-binding GntR family transcriptional regulator